MLEELLSEISSLSTSLDDAVRDIAIPEMVDISFDKEEKNIFEIKQHASWDKTVEARCDFSYHLRMTRRASTNFISIYQKSVFGRTLTDIKSDDAMVPFIAENLVPAIQETIGYNLQDGSWAIVTTPMRRHKEHNFASMIAEDIGKRLGIPFYFDCAHCRSKHRVGAVFDPNNIPTEPNVIVFDDFVTTGSTLLSMKTLLHSFKKNTVFFAAINNKL